MKENPSFEHFINNHLPEYGIRGTYPDGSQKVIERFKSKFLAEVWQVNITNPTGRDSQGNELRSSIIVEVNK
ncbi:MAG: hypothetical protein KGI08_09965 [Thaumarchaeota archaeon]|nr:hypothetical protein [Nitrososphaerota archaeon]